MRIHTISPANRERVNEFINSLWFSTIMVVRGRLVDMTNLDGLMITITIVYNCESM